jgi:hypothetical protein
VCDVFQKARVQRRMRFLHNYRTTLCSMRFIELAAIVNGDKWQMALQIKTVAICILPKEIKNLLLESIFKLNCARRLHFHHQILRLLGCI